MRKKTRIYLDASFVNYLVAYRLPDKMADSLTLWDIFAAGERFEVLFSDLLDKELDSCYEPKRTLLYEKLEEITFERVAETQEATDLAKHYLESGVLAPEHYGDLLHVAIATANQCKLLVSWNFKHMVNDQTMDRVNAVHLVTEYDPIRLVSPSTLLGELGYER